MKLPKVDVDPNAPKTKWTAILTSTPIVLTVVATILAGLSQSEMTQAQYFRSLAAQSQSKASDQWSLFQAKRIRGTSNENTLLLLRSQLDLPTLDASGLAVSSEALRAACRRTEVDAGRLADAVTANRAALGTNAAALSAAASRLRQTAAESTRQAESACKDLQQALERPDVRQAVGYLSGRDLPPVQTRASFGPAIDGLVRAVQGRKPEAELAALLAPIGRADIQQAITEAETDLEAVDRVDKDLRGPLETVVKPVEVAASAGRSLFRAARATTRAAELPAGGTDAAAVRSALDGIGRQLNALKSATDELAVGLQAARLDYTARRYEREARFNERASNAYEVQVRKNGQVSEQHRQRSRHFFYGMLVAQAGVTTASLALAVRHKSLLWGFASAAGLTAIVFGTYAYLYM